MTRVKCNTCDFRVPESKMSALARDLVREWIMVCPACLQEAQELGVVVDECPVPSPGNWYDIYRINANFSDADSIMLTGVGKGRRGK